MVCRYYSMLGGSHSSLWTALANNWLVVKVSFSVIIATLCRNFHCQFNYHCTNINLLDCPYSLVLKRKVVGIKPVLVSSISMRKYKKTIIKTTVRLNLLVIHFSNLYFLGILWVSLNWAFVFIDRTNWLYLYN